LLESKLICSDEDQASVASTQLKVLSVVPLSVIPPPSAPASLGLTTEPSSMFLSSYVTVVELIVVVVPFTVRSPAIVTLLAKDAVFANVAAPVTFIVVPTRSCLARPSPPDTIKAPVTVLAASVVFVILIADPVVAPRLVTVERVLVS